MEVLYIPQLDEAETAATGGSPRYRILKRVPEDGTVILADRAVTKVEAKTADAIRFVLPPLVRGAVRDFFVRLVVTADELPEVTFAAPAGETASFEDVDSDVLACRIGVNVFAFTETDEGVFFVNRKSVDVMQEVAFDACGGTCATAEATYALGAAYGELPTPTLDGHAFLGWFTEEEGGVEVAATDTAKTGVSALFAHWEVYVDPFADAICAAGGLTFFTSGDAAWTVDATNCHSEGGAARSGAISDSQSTVLKASCEGAGTLAFWWKASSEGGYDTLRVLLDGEETAATSGTDGDWAQVTLAVAGGGVHEVRWEYSKDGSVAKGEDCGWVDDVAWTPAEGA